MTVIFFHITAPFSRLSYSLDTTFFARRKKDDPLQAVGSHGGSKEGQLKIRSSTGGLRVLGRRGYNKAYSRPKKKLLKSETLTDHMFIILRFALPGDILALSYLDPRRTNCQRADRGGREPLARVQECLFLNTQQWVGESWVLSVVRFI